MESLSQLGLWSLYLRFFSKIKRRETNIDTIVYLDWQLQQRRWPGPRCVPEHNLMWTVRNVAWTKLLIIAATWGVYKKMLCYKDTCKRCLFNCFAVCHNQYLEALVQHTLDYHKVQRQSTCIRMSSLLPRHRDVAVMLLSALCWSPFYLWFSREKKGCANQATIVVVVIIPWEGREKSTGVIQVGF